MKKSFNFICALVLFFVGLLFVIDGTSKEQVGGGVILGLAFMFIAALIMIKLDKEQ